MSEQTKKEEIKYRFYIDTKGRWYQDGVKVEHRWTYLYNNKLLSRDEEGRYYVDEGTGKLYVEVEDTPFIIKMVDKRDDGFYAILNDEKEEKIDLNNLWINEENIVYTEVKDQGFPARFSRPAYYELAKNMDEEGDRIYVESNGDKYYLEKKK